MVDNSADLGPIVECFLICQYAEIVEGQLFIVRGGIESISSAGFPMVANVQIAIRMTIPFAESNRPLVFTADIHNEDGDTILPHPMRPGLTVGRPVEYVRGERIPAPMVLYFNGVQFPEPGDYSFTLSYDGSLLAQSRVRVRRFLEGI